MKDKLGFIIYTTFTDSLLYTIENFPLNLTMSLKELHEALNLAQQEL